MDCLALQLSSTLTTQVSLLSLHVLHGELIFMGESARSLDSFHVYNLVWGPLLWEEGCRYYDSTLLFSQLLIFQASRTFLTLICVTHLKPQSPPSRDICSYSLQNLPDPPNWPSPLALLTSDELLLVMLRGGTSSSPPCHCMSPSHPHCPGDSCPKDSIDPFMSPTVR